MSQKIDETESNGSRPQKSLKELASVFFQLGLIAFGGPIAHIAIMEEEIVKRRQWISRWGQCGIFGVNGSGHLYFRHNCHH